MATARAAAFVASGARPASSEHPRKVLQASDPGAEGHRCAGSWPRRRAASRTDRSWSPRPARSSAVASSRPTLISSVTGADHRRRQESLGLVVPALECQDPRELDALVDEVYALGHRVPAVRCPAAALPRRPRDRPPPSRRTRSNADGLPATCIRRPRSMLIAMAVSRSPRASWKRPSSASTRARNARPIASVPRWPFRPRPGNEVVSRSVQLAHRSWAVQLSRRDVDPTQQFADLVVGARKRGRRALERVPRTGKATSRQRCVAGQEEGASLRARRHPTARKNRTAARAARSISENSIVPSRYPSSASWMRACQRRRLVLRLGRQAPQLLRSRAHGIELAVVVARVDQVGKQSESAPGRRSEAAQPPDPGGPPRIRLRPRVQASAGRARQPAAARRPISSVSLISDPSSRR